MVISTGLAAAAAADTATATAERTKRPLSIPGMVGPLAHPSRYGFGGPDHHVIVDDRAQRAQCFNSRGQRIWSLPCLARGQGRDNEWNRSNTDTPPGLYLSGQTYWDHAKNPNPGATRDSLAYGWLSIDLVELEGQEQKHGRAGIMVHGGGSGLGWPGAWAPHQPLLPTLGCVRMHNSDLTDKVGPLLAAGQLFWSVYQEI